MAGFGEQLTAARKAKGMTQEALGQALKVARNTVSSWERGRTMPDLDMVRRLSKVLEYDFMRPDGDETTSATDAPELPTETADTLEVPVEVPKAPASRRQRLAMVLAGVAVLLCVIVSAALYARHRSNAKGFPVAYYRQETANDPDRAYFSFTNKTWEEEGEGTTYSLYAFSMYEHNGKPFSITRVEVHLESAVGTDRAFVLSPEQLTDAGLETEIPAYGSFTLDGGFPKGNYPRAGIAVYGKDADGTPNVFYDLIEF